MSKRRRHSEWSIAEELGNITWEYHPDGDDTSLLKPMSDYFEHFPWRGDPRVAEIEKAMAKDGKPAEDEDEGIHLGL